MLAWEECKRNAACGTFIAIANLLFELRQDHSWPHASWKQDLLYFMTSVMKITGEESGDFLVG